MNCIQNYIPEPSRSTKNNLRHPATFLFAQAIAAKAMTVLHECGHALAAIALYKNANPKIELTYFGGTTTYWDKNPRVNALKWFGKAHSSSIVASAGPLTDILLLLGITKASRSDPQIARFISMKAIGLSFYALSALFSCSRGHDFCDVWSNSGTFAYGLLTASCLATTAVVLRNAWFSDPETQKETRSLDKRRFVILDRPPSNFIFKDNF